MKTVEYPQIERRFGLTPREFSREYKSQNKPVVLLDATRDWTANGLWDFNFFALKYGAIPVTCSVYDGRWYQAGKVKTMPLAEFIRGAQTQNWEAFPFYIRDYWGLFERFPELLHDCPMPPHFFDWFSRLPSFMQRPGPRLFMGTSGAVTPLHSDIWGTHAWLTQIVGRKRWILIPPEQAPLLGESIGKKGGLPRYAVDPANPDHIRFPLFAQATPIETMLAPCETIFVPGGWLHHVISLDPAISVTWNFMGPGCFGKVLPNAVRELVWKRMVS